MGALAVTLVVTAIGTSWVLTGQQSDRASVMPPEDTRTIAERTTPHNAKPTPSLPAEDVPGKDVPDLPRYPGSVRVEYEHKEQGLLLITRVRYLSLDKLDVIRAFYRGVFRAEGWKVANVDVYDGEWTFLGVKGRREVNIEIRPHDPGIEVDIELSEPLPKEEIDSKEGLQKRKANPTPQEAASPQPSRSATPTPQPATPAPDDNYYGGEDWDDLGDGGDD